MVEITGESKPHTEEKIFDLPDVGVVDTQYSTTEWTCEEVGLINGDYVISNFSIDGSQETYKLRYNANYYYRAPWAQAKILFIKQASPILAAIQLFDFTWQYQPDEEGDQPPANALEIGDPDEVTPLDINIQNILPDKEITLNPIAGATEASATNYHFKLAFNPRILNTPEGIAVEGDNWSIYHHSDANADALYLLWKGEAITIPHGQSLPEDKEIILTGVAAKGAGDESQFIDLAATTTVVTISWQFKHGDIKVITVNVPEFKRHSTYKTSLNLTLDMVKTTGQSNIPLFVGFVGSNKVLNVNDGKSNLKLRLTNTNLPNGKSITFHYDSDPAKRSQLQIMLEAGDYDWALGIVDDVNDITVSIEGGKWEQKSKEQVKVGNDVKGYIWTFEPNGSDVVLTPQETMLIDVNNIVTSKPTGETNLYLSYNYVPGYKDGQFICQIEKSSLQVAENGKVGINLHQQYGVVPDIDLAIGDDDTGLDWVSDGNIAIKTNNHERIRIDNSGNVGIGTTPSASAKLDVNGTLKATNFNVDGTIQAENLELSNHLQVNGDTNISNLVTTGSIGIGTLFPPSQEKLEVDGTTKTTDLNVTGKVGIGVNSPSENLEVDGTTKTTNLNVTGTSSLNSLNVTEKVGIGTTSPSAKLEVDGNVILGSGSTSIERIIIGIVDSNGKKTSGSGFTSKKIIIDKYLVQHSPIYAYEITFSQEFSSIPIVLANAILRSTPDPYFPNKGFEVVSSIVFVNPFDITKSRARIIFGFTDMPDGSTFADFEQGFQFVAIGLG